MTADVDPSEGAAPTVPEADSPVREPARGAVLDRYVVLEPLGGGGMGVVYAAYDPELDRKVALKLLRADAGGRPGHAPRARG